MNLLNQLDNIATRFYESTASTALLVVLSAFDLWVIWWIVGN